MVGGVGRLDPPEGEGQWCGAPPGPGGDPDRDQEAERHAQPQGTDQGDEGRDDEALHDREARHQREGAARPRGVRCVHRDQKSTVTGPRASPSAWKYWRGPKPAARATTTPGKLSILVLYWFTESL